MRPGDNPKDTVLIPRTRAASNHANLAAKNAIILGDGSSDWLLSAISSDLSNRERHSSIGPNPNPKLEARSSKRSSGLGARHKARPWAGGDGHRSDSEVKWERQERELSKAMPTQSDHCSLASSSKGYARPTSETERQAGKERKFSFRPENGGGI